MTQSDSSALSDLSTVEQIYNETLKLASEKLQVRFRESFTIKQIDEYVRRQPASGSEGTSLFSSILTTAESCFYGSPKDMDAKIRQMQADLESLREIWTAPTTPEKSITPTPPSVTASPVPVSLPQKPPEVKVVKPTRALRYFRGEVALAFAVFDISVILVLYSFLFFGWFDYYGAVTSFFPWSLFQVFSSYSLAASQFYLGIIAGDALLAVSASALAYFFRPPSIQLSRKAERRRKSESARVISTPAE